jgi:hypothetical protein
MRLRPALFTLWAMGCGPAIEVPADDTGGASTEASAGGTMTGGVVTSSTTVPPSTVGSSTSTSTTTSATTDASSGEDSATFVADSGCSFLCPPDGQNTHECSVWEQNCPAGEKCMPYSADGSPTWNGTRCSPLDPDPDAPGESCTVEGSGVSGVDSCDGTSMCWYVDADTLEGTCVSFCTGSEANPMCPDACQDCTLTAEGVLTICLSVCDPFTTDCGEGFGCYLGGDTLFCGPDISGDGGAPGEACEFSNECDPGTMCVNGDVIPECDGSGCCTPYCLVGDDTPCAALPGTECVQLFEVPPSPCTPENLGACAIPE